MTMLPRLASLVFNQPHFITPAAAEAILHALDGRIGDMQMSRFVGEPAYGDDGRWRGYSVTRRGVAVVPVLGELVNRGAYLGASSGLVSYEGLRQQLRNAASDPKVRGLVLDIDSPGGMASGMAETAGLVRQIAAEKPVIAVANSLMASAAYGIASGATRIVATESAQIGSIGVLYIHADRSGQMSKAGVKMTIIHAGAHKADGNPFAPLPDDVRGNIQAMVDRMYAGFIGIVMSGRPQLSEQQVRDTEARVYMADEAVEKGLADERGSFDQAVADAEGGRVSVVRKQASADPATSPPQRIAAKRGDTTMTTRAAADSGWGDLTVTELNQAVQALRSTLHIAEPKASADPDPAPAPVAAPAASAPASQPAPAPAAPAASTDLVAQGRTEERGRIKAILGLPEAKDRPLAALALAIETDCAPAAAAAVLAKVPVEAKGGAGLASQLYAAARAQGGAPGVRHLEPGQQPAAGGGLSGAIDRVAAKPGKAAKAG